MFIAVLLPTLLMAAIPSWLQLLLLSMATMLLQRQDSVLISVQRSSMTSNAARQVLQPDLTVLVVTLQALKMHGGVAQEDIKKPNIAGMEAGYWNLDKHVKNLQSFGQTVVIAFNKFATDTDEEIEVLRKHCEEMGCGFAVNSAFAEGGNGAIELANLVVKTIDERPSAPLYFAYDDNDSVEEKIEKGCIQSLRSRQRDIERFCQGDD